MYWDTSKLIPISLPGSLLGLHCLSIILREDMTQIWTRLVCEEQVHLLINLVDVSFVALLDESWWIIALTESKTNYYLYNLNPT